MIARVRPACVVANTTAVAVDALRAAADGGVTEVVPGLLAAQPWIGKACGASPPMNSAYRPAPFWSAGSKLNWKRSQLMPASRS